MFELTKEENQSLRSQNVILKRGQHSKYLPFAFTEQGVAMLSSVLRSSPSHSSEHPDYESVYATSANAVNP